MRKIEEREREVDVLDTAKRLGDARGRGYRYEIRGEMSRNGSTRQSKRCRASGKTK